jgi:hypothetical protein
MRILTNILFLLSLSAAGFGMSLLARAEEKPVTAAAPAAADTSDDADAQDPIEWPPAVPLVIKQAPPAVEPKQAPPAPPIDPLVNAMNFDQARFDASVKLFTPSSREFFLKVAKEIDPPTAMALVHAYDYLLTPNAEDPNHERDRLRQSNRERLFSLTELLIRHLHDENPKFVKGEAKQLIFELLRDTGLLDEQILLGAGFNKIEENSCNDLNGEGVRMLASVVHWAMVGVAKDKSAGKDSRSFQQRQEQLLQGMAVGYSSKRNEKEVFKTVSGEKETRMPELMSKNLEHLCKQAFKPCELFNSKIAQLCQEKFPQLAPKAIATSEIVPGSSENSAGPKQDDSPRDAATKLVVAPPPSIRSAVAPIQEPAPITK